MHYIHPLNLACAAACLVLLAGQSVAQEDRAKRILGWVEKVVLIEPGFELKAKLDTGANTASLHAVEIEKYKKDDEWWVRFTVEDPESDETWEFDEPRTDRIRIKQHDGSHQTRNVVEMDICFGRMMRTIEVNLIDRSEFIYPLLLGREALAERVVVDPEETFLGEPDCTVQG